MSMVGVPGGSLMRDVQWCSRMKCSRSSKAPMGPTPTEIYVEATQYWTRYWAYDLWARNSWTYDPSTQTTDQLNTFLDLLNWFHIGFSDPTAVYGDTIQGGERRFNKRYLKCEITWSGTWICQPTDGGGFSVTNFELYISKEWDKDLNVLKAGSATLNGTNIWSYSLDLATGAVTETGTDPSTSTSYWQSLLPTNWDGSLGGAYFVSPANDPGAGMPLPDGSSCYLDISETTFLYHYTIGPEGAPGSSTDYPRVGQVSVTLSKEYAIGDWVADVTSLLDKVNLARPSYTTDDGVVHAIPWRGDGNSIYIGISWEGATVEGLPWKHRKFDYWGSGANTLILKTWPFDVMSLGATTGKWSKARFWLPPTPGETTIPDCWFSEYEAAASPRTTMPDPPGVTATADDGVTPYLTGAAISVCHYAEGDFQLGPSNIPYPWGQGYLFSEALSAPSSFGPVPAHDPASPPANAPAECDWTAAPAPETTGSSTGSTGDVTGSTGA